MSPFLEVANLLERYCPLDREVISDLLYRMEESIRADERELIREGIVGPEEVEGGDR